jgi:hypothetical protein
MSLRSVAVVAGVVVTGRRFVTVIGIAVSVAGSDAIDTVAVVAVSRRSVMRRCCTHTQ